MTVSLARRLMLEGVVAQEDVTNALYRHVTERVSFLQGLTDGQPEAAARVETELGRRSDRDGQPVAIDAALVAALPPGLMIALAALPSRRDPETGVVEILAANPSDAHVAAELSFHLGAPVAVRGAPLTAILEAVVAPGSEAKGRTPAFGTTAPLLTASAAGGTRTTSIEAPAAVVRPSERPIPLVKRSIDAGPPSTARHGSLVPAAPPANVSVRPAPSLAPIRPEPIIALTSTAPLGTRSPSLRAPSPAPTEGGTASVAPPSVLVESENAALEALAHASTPEEVVAALVSGLAGVAKTVVVFAARGKNFEGRDTNVDAVREDVRALVIPVDRPSVLQTAVQSIGYVGPVPSTPVHEGLAAVLGDRDGEVAVGAVLVSGRAALVFVAAGVVTTYLATRRGDKLADAEGKALARIVRERKK